MRAVWLGNRQLRLRDDLPRPVREGETRVRILMAGICNTDIEMSRGYYPFTGVPGHEFVGEVEGRRVVGEINAACGSCLACHAGRRKWTAQPPRQHQYPSHTNAAATEHKNCFVPTARSARSSGSSIETERSQSI